MADWMDVYTEAARRAEGLPDNWHAWRFKIVGRHGRSPGLMVLGAVCPPKVRGKNKGQPNYRKGIPETGRDVFVTHADCDVIAIEMGLKPKRAA